MQQGLRVLAVGKGESRADELIFLGLIGISDPPRTSAGQAVAELRQRGVELWVEHLIEKFSLYETKPPEKWAPVFGPYMI